MRLAIVGSTSFPDPYTWSKAGAIIGIALEQLSPDLVISGGAVGIDTLARVISHMLGFEVREYLPENRRWEPNGFKARNILIAEDCDRLIAIRWKGSKTYGSGWTADYTAGLGKPVERHLL